MAGYSCQITIFNSLQYTLVLADAPRNIAGIWHTAPPEEIHSQTESTFEIQAANPEIPTSAAEGHDPEAPASSSSELQTSTDQAQAVDLSIEPPPEAQLVTGETQAAQPVLNTEGSVLYRVLLPDVDNIQWLISAQFSNRPGGKTYVASSTFRVDAGAQQQPCGLFTTTFINVDNPDVNQSLQARLKVKVNGRFTTSSYVSSIRVPRRNQLSATGSRLPTISNTQGQGETPAVDDNFVIWRKNSSRTYEDDSDNCVAGSLYPVAISLTDRARTVIKVSIQITEEQLLGVPLEIYGDNDVSREVIGLPRHTQQVFHSTGRHSVVLHISPHWASNELPWGVAGNIVWRFRVAATLQELRLNHSRLEFYAIKDTLPNEPFLGNTVPVRLLRHFVLSRRSTTEWLRHCASLVFQDRSFKYDVVNGESTYVDWFNWPRQDIRFRLTKYLNGIGDSRKKVNCYDQASIMQICLALSPTITASEWMFMQPFGVIKTANLIGRGACNNPFYRQGTIRRKVLPDRQIEQKLGFGNHAFVRITKSDDSITIVDTCCGPHLGKETLQEYIRNSIDTRFNLTSGTHTQARVWNGVVELE